MEYTGSYHPTFILLIWDDALIGKIMGCNKGALSLRKVIDFGYKHTNGCPLLYVYNIVYTALSQRQGSDTNVVIAPGSM